MRAIVPVLLSVVIAGCECGGPAGACTTRTDCPSGMICLDGRCRIDESVRDAAPPDAPSDASDSGACALTCAAVCCDTGELCLAGARCVRDLGPCTEDRECGDDGWCETSIGRCIPYDEDHDRSDTCRVTLAPGVFRTRVQCEWTGAPAGDSHPSHHNASSLPLVVDFRMDGDDAPAAPSIVVVMGPADGGTAILRVLDASTCALEDTLEEHSVIQGSAPAAGDLDGDGVPEIVSTLEAGGVAAWTYDRALGAFRVLWRSTDTTASGRSYAVTLADLDGAPDGRPEVLVGALVYSADGALLTASAGEGDRHCGAGRGYVVPGLVADVDLDSAPELVRGSSVWAWDAATGSLVRESYSTGPGVDGAAAIADFGEYPGRAGDAAGRPEIAVIAGGAGSIVTIGGDVVFGPVAFPGTGDGGNPTVADFDGDGEAEFATAGYSSYTVFDPDCLAGAARGGACASGRTDGILWTSPIQENSCAIMGSTVFDFEGDGAAEVVYADECFARVFDGRDGTVVWSRARSSATWIEGPTVADVDADFHAEIVMTATDQYRPSCPAVDPIFAGLRCGADADCPGAAAGSCVESLCRCTTDAECGDPELACTAPLAGSSGNVCRSRFAYSHGVRVYGDVRDRWAGSRAIWNQHAYSVTNVEDDGTIPTAAAMTDNWSSAGLNNFRQNVQGDLERAGASDLTVRGEGFGRDCSAAMPALELVGRVCNRGLLGISAGMEVAFYDGDPTAGGTEVCRGATTVPLLPAECEDVRCTWDMPPLERDLDVHIVVDPDDLSAECIEENNHAVLAARCPPPLM